MSQVQPIIAPPVRPPLQAFLIRTTALGGVARWERVRHRGRRAYVRHLWVGGFLSSLAIPPAQVYAIMRGGLPWRTMWSVPFVVWFLSFALGLPLLLRAIAPVQWWLCEEKYRDELAKLGRRPTAPGA